jgi:hypothetical protein
VFRQSFQSFSKTHLKFQYFHRRKFLFPQLQWCTVVFLYRVLAVYFMCIEISFSSVEKCAKCSAIRQPLKLDIILVILWPKSRILLVWFQPTKLCARIFKQSTGTRNRVGIGLSYRPASLHRLAELIPWDRFLGSLKVKKIRALVFPLIWFQPLSNS